MQTQELDRFLDAIDAGDDDVTEVAAGTLTPEQEPGLVELLSTDDGERRWWAVRALAICGGPRCAPLLAHQLTNPDSSVRAAALLSLGQLHSRYPAAVASHFAQMAQALGDDDGLVRQTAADALAMCGEETVDVLAQVMAGAHEGARVRAAMALRRIATMRSAGLLFRYLNDPNYLVRTYAYEGLDEMGLLDNVIVTL